MYSTLLHDLKRRVLTDSNPGAVMSDFFAACRSSSRVSRRGRPLDSGALHDLLQAVLDRFGQYIVGSDAPADDVQLVHVADADFVHGSLHYAGRFAVVMFFADIGVGLLGVVERYGIAPEVRFVRFLARARPDPRRN